MEYLVCFHGAEFFTIFDMANQIIIYGYQADNLKIQAFHCYAAVVCSY
jgi:hypothetical protein